MANARYNVLGDFTIFGLNSMITVNAVIGSQLNANTIAIQDRIIIVRRFLLHSRRTETQDKKKRIRKLISFFLKVKGKFRKF